MWTIFCILFFSIFSRTHATIFMVCPTIHKSPNSEKIIVVPERAKRHSNCTCPKSVCKHTSRTLSGVFDTSLEPSWQKKLIHEKKIPLCAHRVPAARENVVRLLHKILQNVRFETKANKIS